MLQQQLHECMAARQTPNITKHEIASDDLYLKIFGCQRHGWVCMVGKGVASSDIWGKTSCFKYIRNAT